VDQIADEIHLAPIILRAQVLNIYRELGVHNRIAALQKAEDLELL
jgi:ATP/maltotriose-dependent transcriptional regulator MalT